MVVTDARLTQTGSPAARAPKGSAGGVSLSMISTLGFLAFGLAGLVFYALMIVPVPFWLLAFSGLGLFFVPAIFLVILFRAAAQAEPEPDGRKEIFDLLGRSFDSVGAPRAIFSAQNQLVYANQPFVDLVKAESGALAESPEAILREGADALALFVRLAQSARLDGPQHETVAFANAFGGSNGVVEATPIPGSEGEVTVRVEKALDEPTVIDTQPEAPVTYSGDAEKRALQLFESSPVGIALIAADGAMNVCNPAFQDMMGRTLEEMHGANPTTLVRDDSQDSFMQRLESVAAGDLPDGPIDVVPASAPDRVISVFATLVGDNPAGQAVVLHCLDSTAQRNLEIQFGQSQKMQAVGQLAGGIAHDFNNLLTAMIGFCDLLLLRHRPGEQSFADIMQIKQNANRAADLVRQLLAFSRQQTLKPKTLNMTDVLSDLSHLLKRLVGASVELDVLHGRDIGPVRADRGQLEQVIINLVVNARDAMPDGGKVGIRTRKLHQETPTKIGSEVLPAGDWTVIDIVDHGVGIARENLDRIFEPFFSTKDVGSGTGLGLSTVYGIVKQFDGFIAVDSTVGQGTTFSVYLPRHEVVEEAAQQAPAAAAASPPRDLTGAGTILLVEDEDPVRLFGSRALRNKGYTVLEAASGQIALDLLSERDAPVDLIVTDIMMPQMDGTALIKQVRERWPNVAIICISGYAEDTFRQKLSDSRDVHFLSKPFSLDQLAGLVKDVMHGRREAVAAIPDTQKASVSASMPS
jgi:signal transduction histidine kinase/CheY-like chemotaxis protein